MSSQNRKQQSSDLTEKLQCSVGLQFEQNKKEDSKGLQTLIQCV